MRFLCGTVLIFILSSLCDGQLQQSNVQIAGFSCIPTSIFRYQCNLCQCNFFGTSAHCVPAECPLVPVEKQKPVVETTEIPRPDTNSLKIPEPLCRPGEKEKQKDGCNECVCTAGVLWACTKDDCTRQGSKNWMVKRPKRQYSYECFKIIEEKFWVCDTKSQKYKVYLLNTNPRFFKERYVELEASRMKPDCTLVVTKRTIKYRCPDVEDTLDLDDTEAKEIPETTTMSPSIDSASTARAMKTTRNPIDSTSTARTTTENIDASERISTTDAAEADEVTAVADGNVTTELPREVIEDSGDRFTVEEIDSDNFKCKPNKSFKLECNTCWCKTDGRGPRYCTRIACKPKIYRPLNQH